MATTWLTYAWDDNKQGDVDHVAQELKRAGLDVELDRWNIGAGRRKPIEVVPSPRVSKKAA